MFDDIQSALKKAKTKLDDIVDKLEDSAEDWSDEAGEVWEELKPRMELMQSTLATGIDKLHTQADEARLQAHLAVMDASDQWQHLNKVALEFSHHVIDQSARELEHANLQAHLAAMNARDFAKEHGPRIQREFAEASEKVEKAAHTAAQELEKSLETLGDIWSKTGK